MILKQDSIASQAGHWYDVNGNPAYRIIGANGKERDTTLRDARKLNLAPSVSAINRLLAAPGLEQWKRQQLLLAAATLPKVDGEELEAWMSRVETDADEQAKSAMELGTTIHAALEQSYLKQSYDPMFEVSVQATHDAIFKHFGHQVWSAEKSFYHPLGYGGKIDLHAENIVIDFKTSDFKDADKKKGYEENVRQLAAYGKGLGFVDFRAVNVFISTSVPGLIKIVEWTPAEIEDAWEIFQLSLRIWQKMKGYRPE